jgi:hypothetical protein
LSLSSFFEVNGSVASVPTMERLSMYLLPTLTLHHHP